MERLFIGAVLFIIVVAGIELTRMAWNNMRSVQRLKIRKRLKHVTGFQPFANSHDIVRRRLLSKIPWIHQLLSHLPGMRRLDRLVLQADAGHPLDFYLFCSLGAVAVGFAVAKIFLHHTLPAAGIALVLGLLPALQLLQLKQKRIEKFQKQLPEALELVSRALKAGHALTSGMKLAADQFDAPLGSEFEETLDEINFGVSVPEALRHMTTRIDCREIKYFVVAVILQRETGGNLAEIVESLAYLIREKFKLMGKVQALTAEGKLSAVILVMLPFVIVAYIRIVNAGYLDLLLTESMGRFMLVGAASLMAAGILVIRKMIQIKF
ncbi:MAG: type II secretion system F family protein [Desulfobacteraceae bacterium]|jgi:tight adherence protein B